MNREARAFNPAIGGVGWSVGREQCHAINQCRQRPGVAAMIDFEQTYDVPVVGGGPVGFGLALASLVSDGTAMVRRPPLNAPS